MGLLKTLIGAALILLAFYALNEVTGWLDIRLPGFRWGKMEHSAAAQVHLYGRLDNALAHHPHG